MVTLFPYTTLFRWLGLGGDQVLVAPQRHHAALRVVQQRGKALGIAAQAVRAVEWNAGIEIGRMEGRSRHGRQSWHALRTAAMPLHPRRSEEHTSELQSLMRISYAVFCLQKKK